ncbi:MAG: hypothetical protein V1892_01475 [bacterium]
MFFKNSEQKKSINKFILEVIDDIFKISVVTFLIFALFELWRPGFAVNYLNMNMLLGLVLASGIVSLLFNIND